LICPWALARLLLCHNEFPPRFAQGSAGRRAPSVAERAHFSCIFPQYVNEPLRCPV